jgi:plastocyanin
MKKEKIYLIAGGVVVLIIIGVLISGSTNTGTNTVSETSGPNGQTKSLTQAEVPSDIVVPDQGATATSVPKDFAIPTVSIPAAPGADSSLRVFDIKADKDEFSPSTVAAYSGDTVHINFTAVDKTYDITFPDYGMKQTANKGQTKVLEFQANATGKFTYYCDSCGGLKSSAKGYIIVAEKK